jgi:neutral ceramidase
MKLIKTIFCLSFLILAFSCSNSQNPLTSLLFNLNDQSDSSLASDATPGKGSEAEHSYMIGTGISDITGPPAEVQLAGYCDFEQLASGIFMRQWARAFIIKDKTSDNSVVLVTADIPLMSGGVYVKVIKMLKEKFGARYNEKNVIVSATHTHSGPGGYFKTYALNIFAGMTFHEGNFNKIADGVFKAVVMAHNRLAPGKVTVSSGKFSQAKFQRMNRQRSEEAYYLNRDVDDFLGSDGTPEDANSTLTQLKFVRDDGIVIGIYNWTPVHPNVSGSHLKLINGDVSGMASYLFEKKQGTNYLDTTDFVAAFAYSDAADTSSNLPEDALLPQFSGIEKNLKVDANGAIIDWIADGTCDYERLTLRANTIISLAERLYGGNGAELTGAINCRQIFAAAQGLAIQPEYIDERDIYYADILKEDKSRCRLCDGAAGVGFFAGSMEDGDSGMVNAGEGNPRDVTDYSISNLGDLINDPVPAIADILLRTIVPKSEAYREMDCQLEKRMTLSFDELDNLIPSGKAWNMNQPFQIVKIGSFAILALPFEVTTMSGRRLKAEVKRVLTDVQDVMINSTSNDDMRYLTTREEYASQQYEGGATLLGPYSLNAVRQIVHELAETFFPGVGDPSYAVDIQTVEDGLEKLSRVQILGNAAYDDKPLDKEFGDVITQPDASYARGSTVSSSFWGAYPNNNLTVGSSESYLVVEKKISSAWQPVAYDWDPSTRYIWKRSGLAGSRITIEWHTDNSVAQGEYRIRHIGYWKSGYTGAISRYEGSTRSFVIR